MNDTDPEPPARGFEKTEYEQRCTLIQKHMRDQEIDVLWLSTHADILYLTGFLTQFWQSPTRPWYLLLPRSGKPVAVIPSIGEACMQRTWVDDIRTWPSPDPFDDGVSLLVDAVRELAGPTPHIGVPMSSESYVRSTLQDQSAIRSALAGAHWVDATPCIRPVRHIKSASEISKLEFVCNVVSRAFASVPEIIQTGMTEAQAFRAFKVACLTQGADDCAYLVGAASANGYNDIISPPSDTVILEGNVLILDTGCTFDGYYADFNRNFAFTRLDDATRDAHQRVWDATEAGLECVRPGAPCSDVFHAMQRHLLNTDSGECETASVGRMGHGLGIELTETPSIAAFDDTRLQEGMVITLEPSISYASGKMMVHEENVVVTDSGYRLLSQRASRDMPIIN